MKDRTEMTREPLLQPGVERSVARLDSELRRLLGEGTEYVLVISQRVDTLDLVQAVTNATPEKALDLLRAARACGLDSLN